MKIKKFVLTGGPCTGKTTLLKALNNQGYQMVQEAATLVFQETKTQGVPAIQGKEFDFQKKLITKQIELESKLNNATEAFLDRGTVDNLAYCKLFKINPPQEIIDMAVNNRYSGIFLLNFLDKYETDTEVRKEPFEVACKIHNLIKETYQEYGYKLIEVPPLAIEARTNFIIGKIQEFDSYNLNIASKETASKI
jgi:predicted ATPase